MAESYQRAIRHSVTDHEPKFTKRYKVVTDEKAGGATYTPRALADFVASQIVAVADIAFSQKPLNVLDPAVGDGSLLLSLLGAIDGLTTRPIHVHGFETDTAALSRAASRLSARFPSAILKLSPTNFLEFVLEHCHIGSVMSLFSTAEVTAFDLIIANPPYVRTQIMGTDQAQFLAKRFGLTGRVDLYYAFLDAIAHVMRKGSVAGIIVSNRFMTTMAGAAVRQAIRERFYIHHVWDFGDTKLFDAAVLPAVLLLEKSSQNGHSPPRFTSIYESSLDASNRAPDAIAALNQKGTVRVDDGRTFLVRHGHLDDSEASDSVWRMTNPEVDSWLSTVQANTWSTFRKIGKIRVGVKTCADNVFIRDDWQDLAPEHQPELLRPLITHHSAQRFRASAIARERLILYPHECENGKRRAVSLDSYPRTRAYLELHRSVLERRKYLTDGGREWYEIWVPQDPAGWNSPKLVFRDISEAPVFWIDIEGRVVNGDCYWLACDQSGCEDLLWLALAVANSSFIERFYDFRFNNKLYAGRRRFMTQYVEQFPLPDPDVRGSGLIIEAAKRLFENAGATDAAELAIEVDRMVYCAFGLNLEESIG